MDINSLIHTNLDVDEKALTNTAKKQLGFRNVAVSLMFHRQCHYEAAVRLHDLVEKGQVGLFQYKQDKKI